MDELSDFFRLVAKEKKVKKEEFNSLVGDLELNSLFEDVAGLKKQQSQKNKKIKKQKPNVLKEEKKDVLVESPLGLLSEPSDKKVQSDPLTPLNQNFATHEDLQKHYTLFLSRIQQQLSTLGGGGETRLEFLDDVDRDSAKTNNYFLKYNASLKKWVGDPAEGVGITSIVSVSGITTYYQSTDTDDYIGVSADVPVTIVLPQSPSLGKKLTIKDEGNKINTYNINVQAGIGKSVENDTSVIMSINHQSFTFFYNGTNWYII